MPLLKDVLAEMPDDALERIVWLDELWALLEAEVLAELQKAYFDARLQGRTAVALEIAPHGRKTFLAMTRHENEMRGRLVRWGDGEKA